MPKRWFDWGRFLDGWNAALWRVLQAMRLAGWAEGGIGVEET